MSTKMSYFCPPHSYICHLVSLINIHNLYNLGLSSFKTFLSMNLQLNSENIARNSENIARNSENIARNETSSKMAIFRVLRKNG